MGGKLGIWTDRIENVRCAVMLLGMRRLNAAVMLSPQKARKGTVAQVCCLCMLFAMTTGKKGG